MKLVEDMIATLARRFSLKDLGNLSYFLGLKAHHTPYGLHLTQQHYTTDLLCRTNMENAKPVATPMSASDHRTFYRAIVGSLQYLGLTHLDISFAVNRLSQFMHFPAMVHYEASKCMLRYLAGTITHGIFVSAKTPLILHVYSDVTGQVIAMTTHPQELILCILENNRFLGHPKNKKVLLSYRWRLSIVRWL